jgi:hypothetical protein
MVAVNRESPKGGAITNQLFRPQLAALVSSAYWGVMHSSSLMKYRLISFLVFVALVAYIALLNIDYFKYSIKVMGYHLVNVLVILNLFVLLVVMFKGMVGKNRSETKFVVAMLCALLATSLMTPQLIS